MARKLKQFVVRKYVMAQDAAQALRIERRYRPDEVWIDEEWKKTQEKTVDGIGFLYKAPEPEYE